MSLASYSQTWPAPLASGPIEATISLPGSKSLNNRELVLSALAAGPSTLIDPLISRDSELMMAALSALGIELEQSENRLLIQPRPLTGGSRIDCGLAGTVMRFVPPLAALATGQVTFDGDTAARTRPISTTIDSLRKLGVTVIGEGLPFTVLGSGQVTGGELEIDASDSSQFVSGLLLAAARFDDGLKLSHRGPALPSLPHIEMTVDCLAKRGVTVSFTEPASWQVSPGEIHGREVAIEPDLSNAGPFLAAALVAAGSVTISNWPASTTQVGQEFIGLLGQMGASFEVHNGGLTVRGNGEISGIEVDLSHAGELTPTIASLAALANSGSRIRGVGHLRGHETNRLAALVSEINRLGGRAREIEDGLIIEPARLHGGLWRCYQDHRMATAGAIIGLRVAGVEIEDVAVTTKTMPEFPLLWQQMLGLA